MSRLAKKPIEIPEGVQVNFDETRTPPVFNFKGSAGNVMVRLLPYVKAEIADSKITLTILSTSKQARANWGTVAAHIRNAIEGTSKGFSKNLEIEGVGFRAELTGKDLKLVVGFSHPVLFTPPEGVKVSVEKSVISISGVEKELVGRVAAEIRKVKKPEPYKGTGIRYQGEVIRRKAGKKAATTAS